MIESGPPDVNDSRSLAIPQSASAQGLTAMDVTDHAGQKLPNQMS